MTEAIISVARDNPQMALAVVFLLALGESLAVVSLFVPATFILVAVSAVLGAGGIGFGPAWIAASVGAALGYALSYWIGLLFKEEIPGLWPFRGRPELLTRGHDLIARYGMLGVFIGHFFGPARASVPIVAGMLAMRQVPFHVANIPASLVWSAAVLSPGQVGLQWLSGTW